MRIVIGSLLALLAGGVVFALASPAAEQPGSAARGTVVAGFYPLAFAAQQIDPAAKVENLTPPGAEPHDLEVTPHDVRDIQSAGVVLLMGHGFQPQLEQAARENAGGEVLELLDTPGLAPISGDPHVWLDPVLFAKLTARIGEALGESAAARRLDRELSSLDGEYRRGLANCKRRQIVTSHEAFGYLAREYGLQQVAISGISPEAEPTPADLEEAAAAVRRTGATTVFTETLASPKLAEAVARETGADTAVLNPIEGLTGSQAAENNDYFDLMRENLAALRKALDCQ